MLILTLSCRSHSMHYQLFDWEGQAAAASGVVEQIGAEVSSSTHSVPGRPPVRRAGGCRDHAEALALVLDSLCAPDVGVLRHPGEIGGVAHRVPHGGETFTAPALVDNAALSLLKETLRLAPVLNASPLAGIEAALRLLPDGAQVAFFDTAFHHTMPRTSYLYPLPMEWYEKHRVRRYGFHGYAHLHASRRGAALLGRPDSQCTVISVHTGEGTSLCLVRDGVSVDTTMGFSPLDGMMMESACGAMDAGIIPFIMEEEGLSPREVEEILSTQSGSRGIAGGAVSGPDAREEVRLSPAGRLALEMEGYRLRKYLGAYLAAGNPDAIVFSYSAGWGEWPARRKALQELEPFGIRLDVEREREASTGGRELTVSAHDSRIPVFVVPCGEDQLLNREVARLAGWL